MKTAWMRLNQQVDLVEEEPRLTAGGETILLDSCGRGRYTILAWNPVWKETFYHGDRVDVFQVLDSVLEKLPKPDLPTDAPPFLTGILGALGYELAWDLETIAPPKPRRFALPDGVLMVPGNVVVTDAETGMTWVAVTLREEGEPERELETVVDQITAKKETKNILKMDGELIQPMVSEIGREEYMRRVFRVQEYIRRGDIYQANLSYRMEGKVKGHPGALYRMLREANPGAYGAFLRFPGFAVLSSSPEQFLRWEGGYIETRPIKGTRPRGETPEQDEQYRNELAASEKDQAELVMIVDLERNDFGKFCKSGSVSVSELFTIHPHPTVWHQMATVTGELPKGTTAGIVLRSVFPGGSITGAPKLRSMQVIHEVENERRGFYTGSIGYVDTRGTAEWNIAIRTMTWIGEETGVLSYHVGGGIVADSDAWMEYEETVAKGRGMERAIRRWISGGKQI
ncbi:aminodeoxychorismate synthase component I [Melghirimyces algeriensis]|uniref:aminodeoxychorismate synthase n=1 Tax=Melghirimyces algeriensis TaxID=910412 RepID=A0A521DMQ5_9BACL|nr:aminodeoxychorismate synthase component I [Melghirimyces algeriensis]SMO72361.1 aminodeoxychorismate synthase, subunit I [Melghirimyces algeriensis]